MSQVLDPLSIPAPELTSRNYLIRHMRHRWIIYAVGVSGVLLSNITEALVPKCIEWSLNTIQGDSLPFQFTDRIFAFQSIFVALIALLLLQAYGRRLWRLTLGQETHRVAAMIRLGIWRSARFLPLERLDKDRTVGNLMNIGTSDVNTARLIFGWTLVMLFDFCALTIFSFIGMFSIDGEVTAAVAVIYVFIPVIAYRLAHKEYVQHQRAQGALGKLHDKASRMVAAIRLIKLSDTAQYWLRSLTAAAENYRTNRLAASQTSLQFLIVLGSAHLISYAGLFLFGIFRVQSAELTLGGFIALQSYILILQGPVGDIGFVISEWQRGRASLERILDVIRDPSEKNLSATDPAKTDCPTVVTVKDLHFAFPTSEHPLLQGIHFSLSKGEKLGITGKIGSGKSTILQIIAGLQPGFIGDVTVLGTPIQKIAPASRTASIALVEQRPFLFATTVRDNLKLNRTINDDELWHYLELAQVANDVRKLPNGLDTQLGEWGINLSGGQKQRLTIARALCRKPELLLLDDCLSAVDTVTEEIILEGFAEHLSTTTIIWVAHRLSTLKTCNFILNIEQTEGAR